MPIEFRCAKCNRLLRTGDDTVGRQAQCPACGSLTTVPDPLRPAWDGSAGVPPSGTPGPTVSPAGGPAPSQSPFGAAPAQGPFGAAAAAGSPFAAVPPGARAAGDNPYASPGEYGTYAPAAASAIGPFVPTRIDFSDVLERTWAIFKQRWAICLGVGVLLGVIQFGAGFLVNIVSMMFGLAVQSEEAAAVLNFFGQLGAQVFSIWVGIGGALFFLKTARGQSPTIGELFAGAPYLLSVILGSIFWTLICLGVLLVCMLPAGIVAALSAAGGAGPEGAVAMAVICGCVALVGITYVSLRFWAWYYAIIDRDCGVIEAFRLSSAATQGNKLTILGVFVATGLVGVFVVVLTCGLGILAVMPFWALLAPVVYLAMTGQQTADRLWAEPWPATLGGAPLR